MSTPYPIALAWAKEGRLGWEVAFLDSSVGLRATGTAVSADPLPYTLEYRLECDIDFVTRSLVVSARGGGWARKIALVHDTDAWTYHPDADGRVDLPEPVADVALFAAAQDCDLGACPVTNSMPVLRDGLLAGGARDYLMAWVSVPDLCVVPSVQRYEWQRSVDGGGAVIRYSSGSFLADVVFDPDGHVVDYPGLARRITPRPP